MEGGSSVGPYRTASRRALLISVLVLVAVTSALVWNAGRLEKVEAEIDRLEEEKRRLDEERERLTEAMRSLTDAPDGGVRALALRVPVDLEMHDFTVWVDVANLSKRVTEVSYEFAGEGYESLSSTLAETGFAAYFRGPARPEQPVCPGQARVTIAFEDNSRKTVDYDLCTAVGLAPE